LPRRKKTPGARLDAKPRGMDRAPGAEFKVDC